MHVNLVSRIELTPAGERWLQYIERKKSQAKTSAVEIFASIKGKF